MAVKTGVNFSIDDDGKGITFVGTPTKAGQPVPLPAGVSPVWTLSDPTCLVVTADPNDPTGLTQKGAIPSPPVDGTGFTMNLSAIMANNNKVSHDSDPFDIVHNPDSNDPDDFIIQESATT